MGESRGMDFHEVSSLFPLMSDEELDELAADIKANGLKEAIWIHDGKIVDGRNRYLACQRAGVEPRCQEWDGNGSLVSFVVSLNLKRRHLSESQRALVAAKLANISHGGDRRSDQAANWPLEKASQPEAAELLNVGERSVRRAKTIIEHGAPELQQAVERGEIAVSAASEIARMPQDKQHERLVVHFSSSSDDHNTPGHVLDMVTTVMVEIDLDPCSNSKESPNVQAKYHYTKHDDGLSKKWFGRVYMNPPYGDEISKWVGKLVDAFELGEVKEAIALIPSRTDTAWFNQICGYTICFVRGRLKFGDASNSAPFPSAVIYLGSRPKRFIKTFSELGPVFQRVDRDDI